ncbi:MAG: M23 family metallopeptidase [Rickettsiaceae bacterium]|nr:M23 family metallopeptidase [Rickettsiaceae bacterium]MDP4832879.1 M23 family metallopeptidase [Rickettsiaceae bacterium]MDP5021065.1 M23 family metallopeptidase [Rickettsiaceae bacterium]MDP5082807.1 M23 family metallopeptidase [Rickettsiaceae bacterium]
MRFIITVIILFFNFNVLATSLLQFPLKCKLGEDCWIANLPRHYFEEKQLDFRCGPNTYNGHKGTDIALRDLQQMQKGVKVVAPISGVVQAKRNDIDDISVRHIGRASIKGIECGNGVVLSNDDIEAQFCHMKKNSIRVSVGDKVKVGQVIGEVGLSGMTEYPHLHVSFREKLEDKTRELDPFYGSQPDCGLPAKSMWQDAIFMNQQARTGIIYNSGFVFELTNAEQIRSGKYNVIQPETPQEFIGFVDMFSVDKGDKVELSIIDPGGEVLIAREHKFGKYQARYFFYIGKNLRGKKLSGQYSLMIKYTHNTGVVENFIKKITL